jgi:hypothetical protein
MLATVRWSRTKPCGWKSHGFPSDGRSGQAREVGRDRANHSLSDDPCSSLVATTSACEGGVQHYGTPTCIARIIFPRTDQERSLPRPRWFSSGHETGQVDRVWLCLFFKYPAPIKAIISAFPGPRSINSPLPGLSRENMQCRECFKTCFHSLKTCWTSCFTPLTRRLTP